MIINYSALDSVSDLHFDCHRKPGFILGSHEETPIQGPWACPARVRPSLKMPHDTSPSLPQPSLTSSYGRLPMTHSFPAPTTASCSQVAIDRSSHTKVQTWNFSSYLQTDTTPIDYTRCSSVPMTQSGKYRAVPRRKLGHADHHMRFQASYFPHTFFRRHTRSPQPTCAQSRIVATLLAFAL
jgi:hypothetical protein